MNEGLNVDVDVKRVFEEGRKSDERHRHERAAPEQREAPRPLRRELPAAELFPVDKLPEVLRDAARVIHAITRAPIAIGAQSVLAVATLAVQAHADVKLPTRAMRPLSCNFVSIAEIGERKTTADDLALEPVRKREDVLARDYAQAQSSYVNDLKVWEKQRAQVLGDKAKYPTAASKRVALDELGDRPLPPLIPMLTCPEPTFEGLTRLLRDGGPSVAVFSSEGGQFIGGYAMSEENRLKTGAAFSALWDGTPLKRVRQGDGSFVLRGRRVAVHLLVQPGVAARLFGDATLDDQGTLSRLLAVYPVSAVGSRFWKEPEPSDFSNLSRFSGRVGEIQETPPRVGDRPNELIPRVLRLSPAARQVLDWVRQLH